MKRLDSVDSFVLGFLWTGGIVGVNSNNNPVLEDRVEAMLRLG